MKDSLWILVRPFPLFIYPGGVNSSAFQWQLIESKMQVSHLAFNTKAHLLLDESCFPLDWSCLFNDFWSNFYSLFVSAGTWHSWWFVWEGVWFLQEVTYLAQTLLHHWTALCSAVKTGEDSTRYAIFLWMCLIHFRSVWEVCMGRIIRGLHPMRCAWRLLPHQHFPLPLLP